MKESTTKKVDIEDIIPEIFKQFLYFVYSGRLETPLHEDSAQSLFVAANKYDIEDLREKCAAFLVRSLKVENVINFMVFADFYSVEKLKEAAFKLIEENGDDVCQLDDWEYLTNSYPNLCLLITRRMMKRSLPNKYKV